MPEAAPRMGESKMENFEDEHRHVLDEAQHIYKKQSQVRGQMWMEWPPSDKIRELRERVMRLERAYVNRGRIIPAQPGPEYPHNSLDAVIIEDALDIINYAAFLVKQIRRGHTG